MAKKKFYAVKEGKVKGVFLSWDFCKKVVFGYPNAVYKSFENPYDAIDFITGGAYDTNEEQNISSNDKENKNSSKKVSNIGSIDESNVSDVLYKKLKDFAGSKEKNKDEIVAYVDGSYDVSTKEYGSGGVLIKDGIVIESFSQKGKNKDFATMRNVAGEIEAAMYAMEYCEKNEHGNLKIYFDYNGIEKWCTGEWKANKEGTKAYKEFYDQISEKVNITFEKVKAHSGVLYNEMADKLAKKSLFGK